MILTAYAPSYLPWRGMLHRVSQADVLVLCDTDRLQRKDFLNRNRVQTANGPVWLTVPVLGPREQRICDVQIDNSKPWRRKHWKTLEQAYRKAPHWDRYAPLLEIAYETDWQWLSNLNRKLLRTLLAVYGLAPQTLLASELKPKGAGSAFILDMCRKAGATTYLCGEAGRDYLDLLAFEDAGIRVVIQDYPHADPDLSALHHLFTEGPVL